MLPLPIWCSSSARQPTGQPEAVSARVTSSELSQARATPVERCVLEQLACVQLSLHAEPHLLTCVQLFGDKYLLCLARAANHQSAENCVLLCRKQPTKARLAAAAQSKQQLTLVLMKCLPDLLMRFHTDAVQVQHNVVCI